MNTTNQPVSSGDKTGVWLGIIAGGIVVCVCVLAVGLILGLGVGGKLPMTFLASPTPSPTFTPTAAPTDTPTPVPTDTPIPTDTPTPVPSPTMTPLVQESLDTIINTVKPASQGNPVTEAGAYDAKNKKIHPLVVVSQRDQEGWNASLPATWKPLNVGQVELVAVVLYKNVEIEKARYIGKGTGIVFVSRMRVDVEVILREAQTGRSIASQTFRGGEPPSLPRSLPIGTTALYGTSVAYETVNSWLKTYVEP